MIKIWYRSSSSITIKAKCKPRQGNICSIIINASSIIYNTKTLKKRELSPYIKLIDSDVEMFNYFSWINTKYASLPLLQRLEFIDRYIQTHVMFLFKLL